MKAVTPGAHTSQEDSFRYPPAPTCTLPGGHTPSSHPQGPRGCRGTPTRRSAHSTPLPTVHPISWRLAGDRHRRTRPPPRGPAPAASQRRAAGVCTAKWRLCTEPASGCAALISRKHIISRNAGSSSAGTPRPAALIRPALIRTGGSRGHRHFPAPCPPPIAPRIRRDDGVAVRRAPTGGGRRPLPPPPSALRRCCPSSPVGPGPSSPRARPRPPALAAPAPLSARGLRPLVLATQPGTHVLTWIPSGRQQEGGWSGTPKHY